MKVAILGYAREGVSALRFLRKQKKVFGVPQEKVEYWILDSRTDFEIPKNTKSIIGPSYLKNLSEFDVVVRSPGIPFMKKEIQAAIKKDVQITSPTKLFFDHCPGTIIGITGTKGKGTTAMMLMEILKSAKKKAVLVGNIGLPALDALPKIKKDSLVVFELSSFQLQDLKKSPHLAILLDISPDHLNAHKNMREYVNAKASITLAQNKNDILIVNNKNLWTKKIAKKSKAKKIDINTEENMVFPEDLYLPAPHLLKNAQFAASAAHQLGISLSAIKKGLAHFKGYEHRLEFVAQKKGVIYYNDSAATTPVATIAATQSFHTPLILIAGGGDKNLEYEEMARAIDNSTTKLAILIGESKTKIAAHLSRVSFVIKEDLEAALSEAEKKAMPGDVVLFSPGGTSFGLFTNYTSRGKMFKDLVKKIK